MIIIVTFQKHNAQFKVILAICLKEEELQQVARLLKRSSASFKTTTMEGSEKYALPRSPSIAQLDSNIEASTQKKEFVQKLLQLAELVDNWSTINPKMILETYTLNAAKLSRILKRFPHDPPFTITDTQIYLLRSEMDVDIIEELRNAKDNFDTADIKTDSNQRARESEDESATLVNWTTESALKKQQSSGTAVNITATPSSRGGNSTNEQKANEPDDMKTCSPNERQSIKGVQTNEKKTEHESLSVMNSKLNTTLRSLMHANSATSKSEDIENSPSSLDDQVSSCGNMPVAEAPGADLKRNGIPEQETKALHSDASERTKCVPSNPHVERLHEVLRKQLTKFIESLTLGFQWIDVQLSRTYFNGRECSASAEHIERIFSSWQNLTHKIFEGLETYYYDRGITIGEYADYPQIADFIVAVYEMDVRQYRSVFFHLQQIHDFYLLGVELVTLYLNRFDTAEKTESNQN
ncbi:hypothetical protein M514_03634 [Trichuris suis]|uniref:Proteasome activator PA28 C-terminal domain-containing protein n=1 Tax=Trichuris suis TaxID=68888 RepID=A0A085N047_9BILA|nr:hypothetical protein M514_03634 [Trichuris suis]